MFKEKNNPLLSDEFLDEAAKEINQQFGWQITEPLVEPINKD